MIASPANAGQTKRTVVVLMATLFTVGLSYRAVLPVLPAILERAGLSPSAVSRHTGMLTGIYMFAVFIVAPFSGAYSDRVGRRPIIVCGLAGATLALLLFVLFIRLSSHISHALSPVHPLARSFRWPLPKSATSRRGYCARTALRSLPLHRW